MKLIARWFVVALSFLLAAYLIPGIVVGDFYVALLVAFLWGVLNLTVRPILFLLTLPVHIITLGLFTFVLNALLFWLLDMLVTGFSVDGFLAALFGSMVVTVTSTVGNKIVGR